MDCKALYTKFHAAGIEGELYDDVVAPLNVLSQHEHVVVTESEIIISLSQFAIDALEDVNVTI